MKALFISLITLFALTSEAATIDQFCNQFFFQDVKVRCYKIASGKEFQSTALDVCNSFFQDEEKLQCLTNIANKEYTNGELQACKGLFSDDEKQQCLVELGRPLNQGDSRRLQAIRTNAMIGLDRLRMGDVNGANQAFNIILNLARP
jgi:hypothetical protein